MEDYKGYWYHETATGCGSGAGYRNGDSQTLLGAYCCHLAPTISRLYVHVSVDLKLQLRLTEHFKLPVRSVVKRGAVSISAQHPRCFGILSI